MPMVILEIISPVLLYWYKGNEDTYEIISKVKENRQDVLNNLKNRVRVIHTAFARLYESAHNVSR